MSEEAAAPLVEASEEEAGVGGGGQRMSSLRRATSDGTSDKPIPVLPVLPGTVHGAADKGTTDKSVPQPSSPDTDGGSLFRAVFHGSLVVALLAMAVYGVLASVPHVPFVAHVLDLDGDGDCDLVDVHNFFDVDDDGKLNPRELLSLIIAVSAISAGCTLLFVLVVNGAMWTKRSRRRSLHELLMNGDDGNVPRHIRHLFKAYDTDHNGSLDVNELAMLMQDLYPGLPMDCVQDTFDDVDVNKNGRISLTELSVFLNSGTAHQIWIEGHDLM